MDRPLAGRLILVVEDEPIIALDIAQAFEAAGAAVAIKRTLRAAIHAAEDAGLSAAVLDHALGDGDSTRLCQRLQERNIPFVNYTGYSDVDRPCDEGVLVCKPASPQVLVTTVESLLRTSCA